MIDMWTEAPERPWEVLIVDDDADCANLARTPLEKRGLPVCVASTAVQAREQMKLCRVGIVLMDIHLPGVTGIELAGELRKFDPLLPIIYISADSPDAIDDEMISKASTTFARDLVSRVRERMDRYTARCESRETAKIVRALIPRFEKLEAAQVKDSNVIVAHGLNLSKINSATGKAMLIKQFVVAVLGIAVPVAGYVSYVTRDVAKDQLSEIAQIKPMRLEFARAVKQLDALITDRQMERREALQARVEQRQLTHQVLERLPTKQEAR